jgi:hypothetical protein
MAYNTKLTGGNGNFNQMMTKGFGIVTVMNARIFDVETLTKNDSSTVKFFEQSAEAIFNTLKDIETLDEGYICTIDTFKVANVTMEGPTKTITGGQYTNPLIKFGKTARLEMQDALGRADAIEALCGGIKQWKPGASGSDPEINALHFGQDFSGAKLILGDSFFIDRASGEQVSVNIIFYQFSPDSLFNLTQDAEGDATVFDMNGDLLVTNIAVPDKDGKKKLHGVFYSILPVEPVEEAFVTESN